MVQPAFFIALKIINPIKKREMKKVLFILVMLLVCSSASARKVGVFCFFANNGSHIYEDENVSVSMVLSRGHYEWIVYNKTSSPIYIDKGSSFHFLNGQPTCMFTNSSYTSGTGTGSGASVNLGSIAGAFGVGGVVGGLLGGVNVGGSRSNQSSTTTYEQRVLIIPPQSSYTLHKYDWKMVFPDNPTPRKKGRVWSYEQYNSPLSYRGVLRYSTTEDFASVKDVSVDDYVCAIVYGHPRAARKGLEYSNYCTPYIGHSYICKVDRGVMENILIITGSMIGAGALIGGVLAIAVSA